MLLEYFLYTVFLSYLTEDGACIYAGYLYQSEVFSYPLAYLSCFVGLFTGDCILVLIGKFFRNKSSDFLSRDTFLSRLYKRKNNLFLLILLSRFIPGTRTLFYLSIGFLEKSLFKIVLYLFISIILWVPFILYLSINFTYYLKKYFGLSASFFIITLFILLFLIYKSVKEFRRNKN